LLSELTEALITSRKDVTWVNRMNCVVTEAYEKISIIFAVEVD